MRIAGTKLKVLNLYSGVGGNREQWKDVEVHAVDNNNERNDIYHDLFPDDTIFQMDVNDFLELDGMDLNQYDYIWASPPCQTHSIMMRFQDYHHSPDLNSLYGLMIDLKQKYKYKGRWAIENVTPRYGIIYGTAFPNPVKLGRHYIWANYPIESKYFPPDDIINLPKGGIERIMMNPDIGLYIFNQAYAQTSLTEVFSFA